MTKKVAIVQSNYIPWKGYFDLINSVQEFIFFDDAQYTKRDWRNRNIIKTANGLHWLTIPVVVKGRVHQKIREAVVSDPGWASKHWKTIVHWYSKAHHFKTYRDLFENWYRDPPEDLSSINYRFISGICQLLGIQTKLSWSSTYGLIEGKTERLIHLCKLAGATEYVSGPSAEAYLDTQAFMQSGISVSFFRYEGYRPHRQLHPPFQHRVSIIDLLFNEGPDANRYMLTSSQPELGVKVQH